MSLYELLEPSGVGGDRPPVLVLALDGWIDAGFGAIGARRALLSGLETTTLATFDADRLLDFRARRPTMHLVNGEVASLAWAGIELRGGVDAGGTPVLVLVGAEPDHAWQGFCAAIAELGRRFGVRLVVGLGAYPTAVPHTRPPRLAVAASTPEVVADRPYLRATIDVPAGVQAAVEKACADVGIPAVGLWVQVPHYVATMEYPAASACLLDGLADLAGLRVGGGMLEAEADGLRRRLDQLVAANPEHAAMVSRLEEQYDAETEAAEASDQGLAGTRLPTADELAAEVERFLREQGTT
jgi:hypothetical protein